MDMSSLEINALFIINRYLYQCMKVWMYVRLYATTSVPFTIPHLFIEFVFFLFFFLFSFLVFINASPFCFFFPSAPWAPLDHDHHHFLHLLTSCLAQTLDKDIWPVKLQRTVMCTRLHTSIAPNKITRGKCAALVVPFCLTSWWPHAHAATVHLTHRTQPHLRLCVDGWHFDTHFSWWHTQSFAKCGVVILLLS